MKYEDPAHVPPITPESSASPIRLRGAGDLVAAIPALLGFHPHQSLIAVLTDQRSRIACSMRVDLPDGLQVMDQVIRAARTAGATTVLLVIYTSRTAGALPWATGVVGAITTLQDAGLGVPVALLVDHDRYWSYLCHDGCCPTGGREVPEGVTEVEAQRVLDGGHRVVANRDAVTALYRPRPDLAPDTAIYAAQQPVLGLPLAQRCQQALADLQSLQSACYRHAEQDSDADDRARARLGLLLADVTVRDYLLGTLAAAEPDLREATRVLIWVSLTSPPQLRPALAATAAALVALGGNDPAAAWALIDLSQAEPLSLLLATGLTAMAPPALREVFAQALPDVQTLIDTAGTTRVATPKPTSTPASP